jgi:hypothetical protein
MNMRMMVFEMKFDSEFVDVIAPVSVDYVVTMLVYLALSAFRIEGLEVLETLRIIIITFLSKSKSKLPILNSQRYYHLRERTF